MWGREPPQIQRGRPDLLLHTHKQHTEDVVISNAIPLWTKVSILSVREKRTRRGRKAKGGGCRYWLATANPSSLQMRNYNGLTRRQHENPEALECFMAVIKGRFFQFVQDPVWFFCSQHLIPHMGSRNPPALPLRVSGCV